MLDFFRSYSPDKSSFENFVMSDDKFYKPLKSIDVKTAERLYPLIVDLEGVYVNIGQYRGYINGLSKLIHNNRSVNKLCRYDNLSYSKLIKVIDVYKEYIVNPDDSRLSQIHIGFSVPTFISGSEIIKLNILMHKYNSYNHDIKRDVDIEMKQFVYENIIVGVYADSENGDMRNYLKIDLRIKKSIEFRRFGIVTVDDLVDKENLMNLFSMFIERFNELTIVDNINDYKMFEDYDKVKMLKFMNVNYWEGLKLKYKKQTVYRHKKEFERLQQKYGLDKLKHSLRNSLINCFNQIIEN